MIWAVTALLVTHFIADFLLQTDWMALNKSKWTDFFTLPHNDPSQNFQGILALLSHTGLYALCFLPFGWAFALVTFGLHTLTDAVTSRITSKLWFFRPKTGPVHAENVSNTWEYGGGNRHYFFVVIGLDQLIHGVTLLWTLNYFK